MQSFLNSVSAVVVVMLIMTAGWGMGRLGWFGPEHKKFMYRLIIYVGMPAMCVNKFQQNFTRETLSGAAPLLAVPLIGILAVMALAMLMAKVLKLPHERTGVYVTMASLSNAMFIGYPLCQELFGDKCLPYLMLYYLCNTVVFQSAGVSLIASSGGGGGGMFSAKGLLSALKNPPFIAIILSMLLMALDVRLPRVLMSFTKNLGGIVSALGLLYSGYIVYEIGFSQLKMERGLPSMLLMRFVLAPLICLALCRLFGVTGLARDTYAAEMSMPTMTQTVVMSAAMGADERYAAKGAAMSMMAMFIVIPALMLMI